MNVYVVMRYCGAEGTSIVYAGVDRNEAILSACDEGRYASYYLQIWTDGKYIDDQPIAKIKE